MPAVVLPIGHIKEAEAGRRVSCYVSVAYTHEPSDPRVRRHCETMVRAGWRVYHLGLAAESESSVGRLNGVILVRWHRRRYRGAGLLRYAFAYVGFILWARKVLARLTRRRNVDVVHANAVPNTVVLAAGPARRRGAGVILDIHDPVPELFLSKFGSHLGARVAGWVLRVEERVSAGCSDVVLCTTDLHRDLSERRGLPSSKLYVVVNAPDATLFPLMPPRLPTPHIGYHGTVVGRMGLAAMLDAVKLLRERGRDLRCSIWGDGDAVEALLRRAAVLGIGDLVKITGRRIRMEALVAQLADIGVGVVPVLRDSFIDVVLSTKLMEFVRLGIPVVVSWTPAVAYYFPENTVQFVRENTALALADALAWTLDQPEQARERAARAQRLPIARAWQEIEGPFVGLVHRISRRAQGERGNG